MPPGAGNEPEIDRLALRELLLSSLREGTVLWNHKVTTVERVNETAEHRIVFTNGVSESFDLMIGADGAWSKVRRLLSDTMPAYTGVTFVECWIENVDVSKPDVAALIGHGTMFALHKGIGLLAQRNGNNQVRVYVGFRQPLNDVSAGSICDMGPESVRASLLAHLNGWAPSLKELLLVSEDRFVERPLYTLPADFEWINRSGVTLVGDAAHLTPPVGLGVNLAMLDAAELAVALCNSSCWEEAVEAQEVVMRERAHKMNAGAIKGFAEMFADDAPASVLRHFGVA